MTQARRRLKSDIPQVAVLLESSHEVSRGMLRGIFEYARLYGPWRIHIAAGGPGDQALPDLQYWKGSGIIGRISNEKTANDVAASNLPCVMIDPTDEFKKSHPLSKWSLVRCDSQAVGEMAAKYLMVLGFVHFAFVGEPTGINWSRIRQKSFVDVLENSGFSCHIYPIPDINHRHWNVESQYMAQWLKSLPKGTAVFVTNDHRARLVLDACLAADISVPYQMTVLGVNNDELICTSTWPRLSSIALDTESAGFNAAKLLDEMLSSEHPYQKKELTFAPLQVIVRDTTTVMPLDDKTVIQGLEFIRINSGLNIRVSDVTHHLGISRQWAEKLFQKELGHSILMEINRIRMKTICNLVANTELSFVEIARLCGFESSNYLGVVFKKETGMTMGQYRANGVVTPS